MVWKMNADTTAALAEFLQDLEDVLKSHAEDVQLDLYSAAVSVRGGETTNMVGGLDWDGKELTVRESY